jgi:hypothetical protein
MTEPKIPGFTARAAKEKSRHGGIFYGCCSGRKIAGPDEKP